MTPIVFCMTVASVLVAVGIIPKELREPQTFRSAVRQSYGAWWNGLVGMLCAAMCLYLGVTGLLGRQETRILGWVEFETGFTQALERAAFLGKGEAGAFREWSGQAVDGSRYAVLRDDIGAVVRVENLSSAACEGTLNFLSPYAKSALVMRDERGQVYLTGGRDPCPEGEARLQAVFRVR